MTEVKKTIRSLAMCCPIPAVAILSNIGTLLMQFLTGRPPFSISNVPSLETHPDWDVIAGICFTK